MPVSINSDTGNIFAGGDGSDGDLVLRSNAGANRVHLDATGGNGWFGGSGADGDLVLFASSGENGDLADATIHLDGQGANIWAGGHGADGDVVLRSSGGENRIRLDAGQSNMWIGGNGTDGDIVLFPSSGDNQTLSQATIHLDGQSGDIVLQNADCAEDFEVAEGETLEPGTVVALDDEARLRPSGGEYDTRVVGIVAGAGDLRPGIILGRRRDGSPRLPVALMGRVYCKADAAGGAIAAGDLLTTARTPGHVMRATDPLRAFGSVVGKALGGLDRGTGLIQVLVALQ
jgi:hypothetical protein